MDRNDPAYLYSLRAAKASKRLASSRSLDRSTFLDELNTDVQKLHKALIAAQATTFTHFIRAEDHGGIVYIFGHVNLAGYGDTVLDCFPVLSKKPQHFPWLILQTLHIKTLGRHSFAKSLQKRIFNKLVNFETCLVANKKFHAPEAWASALEFSEISQASPQAPSAGSQSL